MRSWYHICKSTHSIPKLNFRAVSRSFLCIAVHFRYYPSTKPAIGYQPNSLKENSPAAAVCVYCLDPPARQEDRTSSNILHVH